MDTTNANPAGDGQITVTTGDGSLTGSNTIDFNFADTNEANAFAEDSSTFWRGQGVYFQGNSSETYQIRSVNDDGEVDSLVTEFTTNSNGVAIINTDQSTIENGQEYVITTGNRGIVVTNALGVQTDVDTTESNAGDYSWEVQEQTLSASFDDESISSQGETTTTTVDLDSNRGNYDVTISANGLDVNDLDDIFNTSSQNVVAKDDDDETITVSGISSNGDLNANFTGIDAGDYEFTFSGADTSASATANITVNDEEGSMSLPDVVTEERGDVATINASFQSSNDGYIQIGSSDVGYNVTLAVEDGGDGQIGVKMNTYEAGRIANEENVFELTDASQDDEDTIKNVYRHSDGLAYDEPLEAGTYDIAVSTDAVNVSTGTDAVYSVQNEDDLNTLDLQERGTQGIQMWTAPSNADFDDQSELLQQINQSNTIAKGDLAVVQLRASGIYGQLSGTDDEIKESLYNQSNGFMLTIEEADPGANQEAAKMAMNGSAVTDVFQDDANNSLYVVVDTGANPTDVDQGDGRDFQFEDGEDYTASWTLNESNPMIDADSETSQTEKETANQNFAITEPDVTFNNLNSNDELQLTASQNAQISGSTTLAPGSEITVRVRSTSDSGSSFLKSVETTVTSDGTFSATVDASDLSVDENFTAIVRTSGGQQIGDEVDGVVVEQVQTETPSEETETPSGETETPSEETPTTTSTGETTTSGGTTTTSGGTTTETTSTNTPGFGVVVALVALVAAALLAVRREN